MKEIIDTIHRNRGTAVLAHPGVNLKGKEFLLEDILKLGIDGIEAFSGYHSPEQAAEFYRAAQEHQIIVTCGSDYHGKTKPSIAIGQHGVHGGGGDGGGVCANGFITVVFVW